MDKKYLAFFGILIFIAFAFGCTGEESQVNETKLEVTQGVGIVGNTLKIAELNPGLEGYISFTVRNNLGGETAYNVTISLENVRPFKIFDCGEANWPNDTRKCAGLFDLDKGLPYSQHKLSRLAPGEEVDVFWRIRAPSADEISNIGLKHPIYYNVEYTYRTGFHQNVIFMSQQEQIRRRQAGEDYQISGESGNTAGELRISGTTQQPIIYFFNKPPGEYETANFSFPLQFSVENQGNGIPISDVVVLFEYPDGIEPDESEIGTYGWYKWGTASDKCDQTCLDNIKNQFGDDFKAIGGTNHNKLLYKVVPKENFIKSFNIFVPLKITSDELTKLKQGNIPLKIYTFRLFTMYTYFIQGKDYITVYPIKVKG